VGAKDEDYILRGERRGAPLNLANLAMRVIKPVLAKAALESNDDEMLKWKRWHAFRRSLVLQKIEDWISEI
jgi:hypothetical protein